MAHRWILATLLGMFAASCGGGDSGSTSSPAPAASTHNVVSAPITGFSSVIANGVEFETAAAIVTLDDQPGSVSDLRVGMVVTIGASTDPATGVARADEIAFSDNAQGPVSDIDRDTGSFVVLGQTFMVDELTAFDDASFDDLATGNVVQVSGLWLSQNRFQATHVIRLARAYAAGMTMETKGVISSLDIGRQRFNIGLQRFDYSQAALELGGADLSDGMYVEVSGTTPIVAGEMRLDRVKARDRLRDRYRLCVEGCDFDLVGYVTSFVSATEFEVDGYPVTTTPSTVYLKGSVDALALDVKVSITGVLDEANVLVADRVVFHVPSVVEIAADIEGIDGDNRTVTVLGVEVWTNEFTLFRDHTTSGPLDFGFDDLATGDRIQIRAVLDAGSVIATRLERDFPDIGVTLKAPVESVDPPSITLLGVSVMSDANTIFQNASHLEVDAETFFTLVDLDRLVRVEGFYDGSSITASKMFLRDCLNSCL